MTSENQPEPVRGTWRTHENRAVLVYYGKNAEADAEGVTVHVGHEKGAVVLRNAERAEVARLANATKFWAAPASAEATTALLESGGQGAEAEAGAIAEGGQGGTHPEASPAAEAARNTTATGGERPAYNVGQSVTIKATAYDGCKGKVDRIIGSALGRRYIVAFESPNGPRTIGFTAEALTSR